jgi:hypothetical protein
LTSSLRGSPVSHGYAEAVTRVAVGARTAAIGAAIRMHYRGAGVWIIDTALTDSASERYAQAGARIVRLAVGGEELASRAAAHRPAVMMRYARSALPCSDYCMKSCADQRVCASFSGPPFLMTHDLSKILRPPSELASSHEHITICDGRAVMAPVSVRRPDLGRCVIPSREACLAARRAWEAEADMSVREWWDRLLAETRKTAQTLDEMNAPFGEWLIEDDDHDNELDDPRCGSAP